MVVYLLGMEYAIPIEMWEEDERWFVQLPAPWENKEAKYLNEQIKAMQGRKWVPEKVAWSFPKTARNKIALDYLREDANDPFERYDREIEHVETDRSLWPHQQEMLDFIMTRRRALCACEQGTGKTLAIIEAMERSGYDGEQIWYVSTVAGIAAVKAELKRWNCRVTPTFFTYDGLTSMVEKNADKLIVPKMLIGDESSKLKNTESHRSRAFQWLSNANQALYGEDGYIILATGTPAPKSPLDWYSQVEICQPGFLREGTLKAFQQTLAIYEWKVSDSGQSYPELVTWRDDEKKCLNCGKYLELHGPKRECFKKNYKGKDLYYEKGIDELTNLYERLHGLVLVKKKKDCLNLPDKHYHKVYCPPDNDLLKLARNVKDLSTSASEALIKLRTLSDGFLYQEEPAGEVTCPTCKGTGEYDLVPEEEAQQDEDSWDDPFEAENLEFDHTPGQCYRCEGTGKITKMKRTVLEVASPKFKILGDILEDHEDIGRIVIFAGFQGSMDRITKFLLERRWTVLAVDGRGWRGITPSGEVIPKDRFLEIFQDKNREYERVAWLGQPDASGMGITLTESPTEVYFSNTFNTESRLQSEDRCHRPGMDLNKGLTIIDIINLPTDQLVLENLATKTALQEITLGQIDNCLSNGFIQHALEVI